MFYTIDKTATQRRRERLLDLAVDGKTYTAQGAAELLTAEGIYATPNLVRQDLHRLRKAGVI